MSEKLITLDQERLHAERVKEFLDSLNDANDLVAAVLEGIDTRVTNLTDSIDDLSIPTKVSELTNDSNYQTDTDVATAIANVDKLARKKIDSLSDIDLTADDADKYIYMLPVTDSDGDTYYQQYMVIDGVAEAMGTTKIDLEGYLTEDDVATDEEVDEMVQDDGFDFGFFIHLPPEMHRMIFRGKNLGTSLTNAQKTAIQNGTFNDLWLGDYWVIGGVNWRIADIDYWWNCGDVAFTKHHLVIMPDNNLGGNKQMNIANTTEGGYVGSLMWTSNMNDAKALCTGAFGSNILSHRDIFCNAVTNGRPTEYAWLDSSIELPTEAMIYGCHHYAVANDGASTLMKYAISKTQLSLFAVAPKFITTRQNYWLQDVVSAVYFAGVGGYGSADELVASNPTVGIRPVFPVGA